MRPIADAVEVAAPAQPLGRGRGCRRAPTPDRSRAGAPACRPNRECQQAVRRRVIGQAIIVEARSASRIGDDPPRPSASLRVQGVLRRWRPVGEGERARDAGGRCTRRGGAGTVPRHAIEILQRRLSGMTCLPGGAGATKRPRAGRLRRAASGARRWCCRRDGRLGGAGRQLRGELRLQRGGRKAVFTTQRPAAQLGPFAVRDNNHLNIAQNLVCFPVYTGTACLLLQVTTPMLEVCNLSLRHRY